MMLHKGEIAKHSNIRWPYSITHSPLIEQNNRYSYKILQIIFPCLVIEILYRIFVLAIKI